MRSQRIVVCSQRIMVCSGGRIMMRSERIVVCIGGRIMVFSERIVMSSGGRVMVCSERIMVCSCRIMVCGERIMIMGIVRSEGIMIMVCWGSVGRIFHRFFLGSMLGFLSVSLALCFTFPRFFLVVSYILLSLVMR